MTDNRTQGDWDAAFAFANSVGGADTSLLSQRFADYRLAAAASQRERDATLIEQRAEKFKEAVKRAYPFPEMTERMADNTAARYTEAMDCAKAIRNST